MMSAPASWRCLSCSAEFASNEEQRAHYKAEWHRYNVTRRAAGLAGVARAEYEARAAAAALPAPEPASSVHCAACRKSFSSAGALASHCNSRRHRQLAAAAPAAATDPPLHAFTRVVATGEGADTDSSTEAATDSGADTEEVDSSEWEQWSREPAVQAALARRCLFCPHAARSWRRSLQHMSTHHSFFIPDEEYCVDVPGLLAYLSEKISVGLLCVWCERGFESALAVRQHMSALGHCRLRLDGHSGQYEDYYDYSASYPPGDGADDDGGRVEGWALRLGGGRQAGHRELLRYYRQRLTPGSGALVSRRPGAVAAPARPLPRPARAQRRLLARAQRLRLRLSLRANKFQPHYRPQVNF